MLFQADGVSWGYNVDSIRREVLISLIDACNPIYEKITQRSSLGTICVQIIKY